MFKNLKKQNSVMFDIIYGIVTAVFFSAFIYLAHYGFVIKILNTILAISSLALFLYAPKRAVLIAGFSVGLLWFYWIGYSFKYQGVGYIAPVVTFGFAVIYMLFFGVLALSREPYIRAVLLFGLSFFEPFDWNWLQIELIFVDSYIGIFKYQLALILFSLSLPFYLKKYRFAPLLLILCALNFAQPKQYDAPLRIKLIQTNIKQDKKWLRETLRPTILLIYKEILDATKEGYDVVVFPESVFPLYMNRNPVLIEQLQRLSRNITIIAGTLFIENKKHYNVTYMFKNGNYEIAKKIVLVPFGEYIPLPKFARNFINEALFSGQSDFVAAKNPTDFVIKGIKFRNAICYEATCQEIYNGDVKFVIASSNNAWFAPSIESTLQKLLMEYYARKNGVTIYHSANYQGTGVIK